MGLPLLLQHMPLRLRRCTPVSAFAPGPEALTLANGTWVIPASTLARTAEASKTQRET